jgi:tetratricopeptide (TPR) repeat protein
VIRRSLVAGLLAAGGAALVAVRSAKSHPAPAAAAPAPPPLWVGVRRTEGESRELDIAFYQGRALRDPTGALDLARLAALYQQRGRETGNYEDVLRAESTARRSLRNRATRNATAAQVLAAALLSEHRFSDALMTATALAAGDPDRISYRAARGEIEMELGRYDAARATFDSLRPRAADLSVAPRLARWAEIEGRPDEAGWRLRRALRDVSSRPDVSHEQLGWFWLRIGDLELRRGAIDSAEQAYHHGLAAHPDDYRILSALAHLDAMRHRWSDAIADGNRAVAASLDPATFGTISDAYLAVGDRAKADAYARGMEVAVSRQPGAYHRAWSLFLLDHERRIDEVLRKARVELRTRRDIYGYDVVAWALYRKGQYRNAQHAIAIALGQHTQDALLLYHAGMIARALGRDAVAIECLSRALAINPWFHSSYPDSARAVLATLRPS